MFEYDKTIFLKIASDCEDNKKIKITTTYILVNLSCKDAKKTKIFHESFLIPGLHGYVARTIVITKTAKMLI